MRAFLAKAAAAIAAYGPWGVLLLAVPDSMGIPLPAAVDALVMAVGATNKDAPARAYYTALLAVIGSVTGNIVLFQAARHGRKIFSKEQPEVGKGKRFEAWFYRYGLLSVFIPAVTPVLPLPLKVFVISAGALRTPLASFVGVIVLARVLRYFGLAYLGIQLGDDAQGFLQHNGWTLTGVALGIAFLLVLLIRMNDRRRQASTIQ